MSDPSPPPDVTAAAPARVPSPEATGGAGGTFESRTAAITLARLLRDDRLPGLGVPPRRVRLQQRVAGALLDDIVVDGLQASGTPRTIEYQVKRQLSPGSGDPEFVEIIQRCLTALTGDVQSADPGAIAAGRHRFGIAAQPSTALRDLARVTVIARSHDTPPNFRHVIQRASRSGVRQRYDQLRDTVETALTPTAIEGAAAPPAGPSDAELDDATWRVARALHIWQVDAEPDGRDVLEAQDRLADLLPPGAAAAELFWILHRAAENWAPQAGAVDLNMLRGYLELQDAALTATPARRVAFTALQTASTTQLDPAAARLGQRLTLPRTPLREQVLESLDEHPAVLLTGRAGVGKSILALLVGRDLMGAGDVVVALTLAGRTGGLADLEAELHLQLAQAFAGAPIGNRRVLLLDGSEQALTDAGTLLTAVLRTLPATAGYAPPWRVLATAREEAAGAVAELLTAATGVPPHQLVVAELDDTEVTQVIREFPVLEPIGRNPRARSLLLRRPYLVELLLRGVASSGLPVELVGEEDLLDMVMVRLVRRGDGSLPGRGQPDARADTFLALADAAIADVIPARLDGHDPEARAGLRSDDVLTPTRHSWRFAHDILADYAVVTRLMEPDGATLLTQAPAPRRLLRAVRLSMQRHLADAVPAAAVPDIWSRLLGQAEQLTQRDGPRWQDLPWEALLHLGASRPALDALTGRLLAGDGAGLLQLIDVAKRRARRTASDSDGSSLLDPVLSAPIVDLLTRLADQVPSSAQPAAIALVHSRLRAAAPDIVPAADLVHAADLPSVLLSWCGETQYGDPYEHTIDCLALLGHYLNSSHEQWLLTQASDQPDAIANAIESPTAAGVLAHSRPDLLLRLAGLYYLGRALTADGSPPLTGRLPRSSPFSSPFESSFGEALGDEEDGVREHSFRQPTPFPHPSRGPFGALLAADPARGLRLIGAVVDTATTARAAVEAGWTTVPAETVHDLELDVSGDTRRFTGPATVWLWHRGTSVGPGPALSALMALRAWAATQLRKGTPPATVRETILTTGASLAFPAVAVSVLIDVLDQLNDELDPLLVHPLVWHLEVNRKVAESSGLALQLPESRRLSWTMSEVAMSLVVRSDAARREQLTALAAELLSNVAELPGEEAGLVVQRWASELDVNTYQVAPSDDGLHISVGYSDEITSGLAASGGDAVRALREAHLMRVAAQLRDDEQDPNQATSVWDDVLTHYQEPHRPALYDPADVLCAAAAALVRAAAEGAAVDDDDLRDAVGVLLEGAELAGSWAPPRACLTDLESLSR